MIKGAAVECSRCGLVNYVPAVLCTPEGTVRCSLCGRVVKRDMRRWWRRLAAYFGLVEE